ncbi:hypothetical protein F2Q70_00012271 [Brassica cretica]|uniref:Uncharacterized protein n=1 Tax=Brassica cretica TaxID=69181 RepID=A0A8S9M4M6_BRACR|nr:hypothetical protein F2Q70_00012271 [Brassica cretica]
MLKFVNRSTRTRPAAAQMGRDPRVMTQIPSSTGNSVRYVISATINMTTWMNVCFDWGLGEWGLKVKDTQMSRFSFSIPSVSASLKPQEHLQH